MNQDFRYAERIHRLQALLGQHGLDYYLATRQGSISYLLGAFAPWRTAILVPKEGPPELFAWVRESSRLVQESWFQEATTWPSKSGGFIETIVARLYDSKSDNLQVGVEIGGGKDRIAPGVLYAFEWQKLQGTVGASSLVESSWMLDSLMVRKEPEEILALRQVAAIADAGAEACLNALRPGVTESYIAGVAELAMRQLGSEWFWSVTGGNEVGSGYRTGFSGGVTQPTTTKIVQRGDMVIMDLHPVYRLYYADLCINAVVGKPAPAQRELADVWEDLAEYVVSHMREGMVIDTLVNGAIAKTENTKLSDFVLPMFGHGIGTCSRIPHVMEEGNESRLEQGMVLVAGAHVYQPGVGGMRLEMPVLVGTECGEPLSKTAMKLHVVEV